MKENKEWRRREELTEKKNTMYNNNGKLKS